MRFRATLAALVLVAIVTACQSPLPSGGTESTAPSGAQPSDPPEASATPYTAPGY